jgi:CheY-like chemotaxis protein
LAHSFCQHVVATCAPLTVADTSTLPAYADNHLVRELRVAAYLGVPLLTDGGHAIGSYAVMDRVPRHWTNDEAAILQELAAGAMHEIALAQRLRHALSNQPSRDPELVTIACDLNDTLTVIGGAAALVADTLDPDDQTLDEIDAIRQATERAALLVEQLFAAPRHLTAAPRPSSRHKQLRPAAQDVPHGQATVLLVEDEAAIRTLVARMLRTLGYTVFEAESGAAALALLDATDAPKVDLVLTDVVMPSMRGTDLVTQLRTQHPAIKVLLMSGYPHLHRDDDLARQMGFVAKPFSVAELAAAVRKVLDAP